MWFTNSLVEDSSKQFLACRRILALSDCLIANSQAPQSFYTSVTMYCTNWQCVTLRNTWVYRNIAVRTKYLADSSVVFLPICVVYQKSIGFAVSSCAFTFWCFISLKVLFVACVYLHWKDLTLLFRPVTKLSLHQLNVLVKKHAIKIKYLFLFRRKTR